MLSRVFAKLNGLVYAVDNMPRGHGNTQKKIILLLWGGLALGLSGSPKTSFKIIKGLAKEWEEINHQSLRRAIKNLYKSKMLEMKYDKEKDAVTIVLTEMGEKKALTYDLDKIEIKKPKKWDGKWRIVLFDIPEPYKKERDALRFRLKQLEFFEYQKSVFVHPYDCKNEIDYLVEFDNLRKFVRFVIAESLDNELHLKEHFGLI